MSLNDDTARSMAIGSGLPELNAQVAELQRKLKLAKEALEAWPCNHRCFTHGYGCGLAEETCNADPKYHCIKCAALAELEK